MTLSELNYSLYKTAEHLLEASRYMSNFSQERAFNLAKQADMILSVIEPQKEKMSEERLDEVLGEIMAVGGGNE